MLHAWPKKPLKVLEQGVPAQQVVAKHRLMSRQHVPPLWRELHLVESVKVPLLKAQLKEVHEPFDRVGKKQPRRWPANRLGLKWQFEVLQRGQVPRPKELHLVRHRP